MTQYARGYPVGYGRELRQKSQVALPGRIKEHGFCFGLAGYEVLLGE
ncbi:hypothetical protein [Hymenobacter wooponensis]|nr:hypothetical protein [Hymenobacter wooponensis]